MPRNIQGAFWLGSSVFAFTAMAGLAKYLGNDFHAFQISFFRSFFSLIVISPFLIRAGAAQGGAAVSLQGPRQQRQRGV